MNEEILEITKKFHDTYEKLSKEYNYETRKETRVFDINSSNGKLMYATVNEIISPVLEENQESKKQLENCYCNRTDCSGRIKDSKVYDSLVQKVETQQKEFIKYLEDEIKSYKNRKSWNC